ncbi:MAG: branched-chain amino acid ABC transporter substrate-binding protein [Candidatus Stahlbacteria bacterium]|nr:branched-chain amino acid ABC transporter substrate-binding protein [Candidatus Stahlbacteria bacterium]
MMAIKKYLPCLLLLCVSACKKEDVIRIGIAGPLTGDQAKMGYDLINGVTLAIDEWNAKGGILGKKIVMLKGDDRRDPREAVSVANKMANEDVVGVIGHFNSSCSVPASTIYNEAGVIQITPASTNPKLTEQGFKNVFRICGRDDQQGLVGARFVLERLKKHKIAILHDKTTYGQGLADEFKKNVENKADVVAYEGIVQGENDYTAVLTKLKQQTPEVIYFGGIYPEAGLMVKQMKEIGLEAIFVAGDGVIDPEFIKIGGKATEGVYLSFGPSVKELPTAKHFIDEYTKRFGEIGPYSVYSYDAANILLSAMERCKNTERDKVAETLRNIKYDGAIGHIEFDEHGDVKVAPYIFWVVKDGKFVPAQ